MNCLDAVVLLIFCWCLYRLVEGWDDLADAILQSEWYGRLRGEDEPHHHSEKPHDPPNTSFSKP